MATTILAFVTTAVLVGSGVGAWWSFSEGREELWTTRLEPFKPRGAGFILWKIAFILVIAANWVVPFTTMLVLPYRVAASVSRRGIRSGPDTMVGTLLVSGLLPVLPLLAAFITYRVARIRRNRSPN